MPPDISADESAQLHLLVDSLGYELDPSILIGGWATYLRVGGDISQDIDLIVQDPSRRVTLRDRLEDYSESSRHSGGAKKARGTADGIHIDAYFPYESQLGDHLLLKVEVLARYVDDQKLRGWSLLTIEAHITTKMAALLDRPDSEKGAKDARELVRLIEFGGDPATVIRILLEATAGDPAAIPDQVARAFALLADRAGFNKAQRKRYRDMARDWEEEARIQVRGSGPAPVL
ncbi:nucleotidyl transferase AbiEii/AbiGii toxin family protein [Clavibacter sp. VKM Ac-2873]|uniref:nucleotidyl transferase AbiEii/AbiGii toxin family protein n=1 Tax=Clavibacter sp. VKM Ac-2873 TaxID=2783813 RepID=UPI00188CE210|nr:nucleotidyl transferase AbiEii/AbiGii toxin family protein [Clavibacter sp. VKM Ac-2873]MBF4618465.1 nucleotidyl transferase AbiEii/AbiGii toxin family protein [Clavibacter sp. VKM Ac-2873]